MTELLGAWQDLHGTLQLPGSPPWRLERSTQKVRGSRRLLPAHSVHALNAFHVDHRHTIVADEVKDLLHRSNKVLTLCFVSICFDLICFVLICFVLI